VSHGGKLAPALVDRTRDRGPFLVEQHDARRIVEALRRRHDRR
jgi:hypothetical protein